MHRCGLAIVFLSLGLVLLAYPASGQSPGQPKPTLLVLRAISDNVPGPVLHDITTQLVTLLKKYDRYRLLPVPRAEPVDMMLDAGCVDMDAACLKTLGKRARADLVLLTEVTGTTGRYQVNLRMVDVGTGESRSPQGGESTETVAGLGDLLKAALARLIGPLRPPKPAVVRVQVETSPPGAHLYVDGEFKGVTPKPVRLVEGKHSLRLSLVGYEEMLREIRVVRGKPLHLKLQLVRIPVVPAPVAVRPPPPKEEVKAPFYETWWFWTAVGVAVVGGGTAAFLLATQQKGAGPRGTVRFTLDPRDAVKDVTLYSAPGL